MSRLDARSILSRLAFSNAAASRPNRGARRKVAARRDQFERLENRVLLFGDHPSFSDFPTATTVTIAANLGTAAGVIEAAGTDDLFRFTMPDDGDSTAGETDFTTILADALTGGTSLDTRLELYRDVAGVATPVLDALNNPLFSSGNGVLTAGTPTDAWVGFMATEGQTYFIRVLSNGAGATATGSYTLRIDTQSVTLLAPDVDTGRVLAPVGSQTLTRRGEDIVFKYVAPTGDEFDSLVTANAPADPALLDTRLDLYDAQGLFIRGDSQAGRLTNPFTTLKAVPGATYFVRVRSDEFAVGRPATGDFEVFLDVRPTEVDVDPILRFGEIIEEVLATGQDTRLYSFESQGTGLGFVTTRGMFVVVDDVFVPGLGDPAVHMYNENGVEIAFNDDFAGQVSQIVFNALTGGKRYYLVVESFDNAVPNGGGFRIFIESNHTFDTTTPIDDELNTPTGLSGDLLRLYLERAVPIGFGQPELYTTGGIYDNPLLDHSYVLNGTAHGRIWQAGDTDLYQFTPPVDMLGEYAGNNDDVGTSLFVGGDFTEAGGRDQNHISIWDANGWYFAGRGLSKADGSPAHVYAMVEYDPDGDGPSAPFLVVGGDFDQAETADPDAPLGLQNIAAWAFDVFAGEYHWFFLNGEELPDETVVANDLDGPVFALEVFDRDGDGEDFGPELIIGGDFNNAGDVPVNNIVGFSFADIPYAALTAGVTGGTDPEVRALTVFDGDDLGVGTGDVDPDPVLIVGGQFTTASTQANVNNIAAFNGTAWLRLGPVATSGVTGGAAPVVKALTSYEGPHVAGAPGDPEDPTTVLIVGGQFTTSGGTAGRDNITAWTGATVGNGWLAMYGGDATGTNASVNALALIGGTLLAGGTFTDIGGAEARNFGVLGEDPDTQAPLWLAFEDFGGVDGTVHAMTNLSEDGAVYIGGEFETVTFLDADGVEVPISALNVVRFTGGWAPLGVGVNDAVFALGEFDDQNPDFDNSGSFFDRGDRASTRLKITLAPTATSFLDTHIRVFDSGFNLIYENETIVPPFLPDPSGAYDNSIDGPGIPADLVGPELWGGETYYIEVSGAGTGRYTLNVTVDALALDDLPVPDGVPPDAPDGVHDDSISRQIEVADEGLFATAPAIPMASLDNGNARNFTPNPNSAYNARVYPLPGGGSYVHVQELAGIETIDDTDLYRFRPEFTGTMEIRVNTTNLADEHWEFGLTIPPTQKVNTYSSALDSVLRVFNSDLEQVAYNDDNPAHSGSTWTQNVGAYTDRTFWQRDARIVIPVIAGEIYYIQVESGQQYADGRAANPDDRIVNLGREIDSRHAIGSYELLIHTKPNLFFTDDNHDTNVFLSTTIPISADPAIPETNGRGSIGGVIDHTIDNPFDTDIFNFIATASATATVRVARNVAEGTLLPGLVVTRLNAQGAEEVIATANSSAAGVASLNFATFAGEKYFVRVTGGSGTEGEYTLSVSGMPYADDFGDAFEWWQATDITLFDFLGQGSISGALERGGDTDVFRFRVEEFDRFLIDVTSTDSTMDPVVRVFEVYENADGLPIFHQIAFNDNIDGTTTDSRAGFPVTPDRLRTDPDTGDITAEYPYYYVVVDGATPANFGSYTLTITFTPTDDHPDAPADTGNPGFVLINEFAFATSINLDSSSGLGDATGLIEVTGDTDLFTFTAPAGGTTTVTLDRAPGSLIRGRVSIVSSSGQVLTSASAPDDASPITLQISTPVVRGTVYFIVVEGLGAGVNVNTTDTGAYTVGIAAPPIDDHANRDEFTIATVIPLSSSTGDGAVGSSVDGDLTNPRINYDSDTDLFRFTTVRTGNYIITIDPFNNALGNVAARVTLFASDTTTIIQSVSALAGGDPVTLTITNAPVSTTYYILVEALTGIGGATATGQYFVAIDGPAPIIPPDGTDPDEIDFNTPRLIVLSSLTGDGSADDAINVAGDRDLFTFTPVASGRTFVQIVTPQGSVLDASVTILDAANESAQIAFDSDGIPGATSSTSFIATAGQQYFVIVDGLGNATGTYIIRVNTLPVTNRLYYPEGFASSSIYEFVSIANPNDTPTNYTVVLHYEFGGLETIVATGTVAARSRGGATISEGPRGAAPGVRTNEPYTIIVESDAPLGATVSHYDFGTTIGDALSERTSATWTFARVERNPGTVLDFIVLYNPTSVPVEVTISARNAAGAIVTATKTVEANRRSGWSINDLSNFPLGVFGVTLTSRPLSGPPTGFPGIVAAVSHYNVPTGEGFGTLGSPNLGDRRGVIPSLTQGDASTASLSIYNPGTAIATVTIIGAYAAPGLPQFTRVLDVDAGKTLTLSGGALGLIRNQSVGISYSSNVAVTVLGSQTQFGDGDATATLHDAGTSWFFGDAFIDTASAGLKYFEYLNIHNPANIATTVTIDLIFTDGTVIQVTRDVAARGFAEIRLHELDALISGRPGLNWFGVLATAATPFMITMTHYDLLLNGGWTTSGTSFGPLNELTLIA